MPLLQDAKPLILGSFTPDVTASDLASTPAPVWLPRRRLSPRLQRYGAPVGMSQGLEPRDSFWLPTHPLHNALRRGLITRLVRHEEAVRVRHNGRAMGFQVQVAPLVQASDEAVRKDANLLRTHLDLLARAARPGAAGGFWYDMPQALARLGYKRQGHGAFHTESLREHGARLRQLANQRLIIRPEGGRPVVDGALWTLGGEPGRRVYVAPGAWLGAIAFPTYRLDVPAALLALDLAGQGNEVNRLALLLAAELAVWERTEARRGAGQIRRSVGALLSHAGVTSYEALEAALAARSHGPKRLRSYLAGEGFADEGAFARLREVGGFGIDIADEAAFWAAGRGWLERFWQARLVITVRPVAGVTPQDRGGQPLARPA